ncbi:MAG: HrcA family transcriptional regulator, partial [Clostridiales bacterium]|nr:HrcA family transcriptional regulator [Clostridiales bacterium]
SMAITPQIKKSYLKALQVVPVDAGKALVIVVTNAGLVRNTLVNLNMEVKPEILISISNILNERLSGLAIDQFNATIIKELEEQTGIPKDILFPVLEAAADCINHIDHPEVYMDGATNIFNYPEFRDILKAKEFMSIMDEKANLFRLLNDCIDNMGISIKIGAENDISGIKDCSIVTANYTMGGNLIGTIGIIGPTRMEYPRVISSMSYIRKMINEEITRLMGVKPDNTG